jgi:threonine dehydratase
MLDDQYPNHWSLQNIMNSILSIDRLLVASTHIDPHLLNTPVISHPSFDAALGCLMLAKLETLNPIRSFKGRGTEYFAATQLQPGDEVVCASAGNFGQGMARAAIRRNHACTVYAAETANPSKLVAMRHLGANVVLSGQDFDAAKLAGRSYARERGLRWVEDGADVAIAEGAGTIGLELAKDAPSAEFVLVPLGNGGLLAGVGAALRHRAPHMTIIAVVAEQAPAMKLSLEANRIIETESAMTMADGVGVRIPVPESLEMLKGMYDSIVAVSEADILRAMRLCLDHLGLVIEPAGAIGVAAVLKTPERYRDRTVATILCGSNISEEVWKLLYAQS